MLTLNRGKNFFIVGVSKHWHRVPGEMAVLGGTGEFPGHDLRQPAPGACAWAVGTYRGPLQPQPSCGYSDFVTQLPGASPEGCFLLLLLSSLGALGEDVLWLSSSRYTVYWKNRNSRGSGKALSKSFLLEIFHLFLKKQDASLASLMLLIVAIVLIGNFYLFSNLFHHVCPETI